MVKLTYSSDISDSVGVGGEIVRSASDLRKQASTIFGCEYDELKPPSGKTGIHLVAIGVLVALAQCLHGVQLLVEEQINGDAP